MVDQGRFLETLSQPVVAVVFGLHVLHQLGPLVAQHEFELAKLDGLESGRGFQPVAERVERQRGHRFQDVQLADERLEDHAHPFEQVQRGVQVVGGEQPLDAIQFVQQLLEPQLVNLMDHDKEHLVVFLGIGLHTLRVQQRVEIEVAGVSHLGHRVLTTTGVRALGRSATRRGNCCRAGPGRVGSRRAAGSRPRRRRA